MGPIRQTYGCCANIPSHLSPFVFPRTPKDMLQKSRDALPAILPGQSFCELLPVGIIMRMHHLRIRRISHRVSCFHRLCRIDHIFIKYRMSDEPAQFLIDLPAIGCTDIGAEKGLDPQAVQVCCRFDPGLCRIVKFSGIALHRCRILSGQLSRIGHRHFPLQGFHQFSISLSSFGMASCVIITKTSAEDFFTPIRLVPP